ncbi:Na+/H+ antiporter subunit E [Haliangium sp.]|uniref:Na+/H+ antiporter subunit E n=1 Tax=Haliangium sp. TaxID=2663208 RepID=UPI003D107FCA
MRWLIKAPKLLVLLALVTWELLLSSLRIAWDVITPRAYRSPGIVAVPVPEASERELALVANLITFTPGSLSVDLSADGRTLYVHCMFADDPEALRRALERDFVRRVLELLR